MHRHSHGHFCLPRERAGQLGYQQKDSKEGCDGQERAEVLCPGPSEACSLSLKLFNIQLADLAPV